MHPTGASYITLRALPKALSVKVFVLNDQCEKFRHAKASNKDKLHCPWGNLPLSESFDLDFHLPPKCLKSRRTISLPTSVPLVLRSFLSMSSTGLEDIFMANRETIQQVSADGVIPDRNDTLCAYAPPSTNRWFCSYSGDTPWCLWHDGPALGRFIDLYSQVRPTTGEDVHRIEFVNGEIAHEHSPGWTFCAPAPTREFWAAYPKHYAEPGSGLPPLVPLSYPQDGELAAPAILNEQDKPLDLDLGHCPGPLPPRSPLPVVKVEAQEREIRPLPRGGRERAEASPVAASLSPSSSLTLFSPSPPPELRCLYLHCDNRFPSLDMLYAHLRSSKHPKGEEEEEEEKGKKKHKYRCAFPGCVHMLVNRGDFPRHAESAGHCPERRYVCGGCRKGFTRVDALKRHQVNDGAKKECRKAWREEERMKMEEGAMTVGGARKRRRTK
ncbi:uncharacterized protein BT62DRAFT_575669 [Guyanagaster necrorhizus]|uniref:C2H2-type domain-containing protein n=1 Tax=Guyanagaster necrorhizus TaxID=856835 RepID=A0A9P7VH96_9AGAR|nr:uncharacterized protein BT62DRAFT_575574 [Guyanagaster necrorhizus MCA 3950]XP_043034192.1 uncharacterized protein BT62DRAFT_575669 [Guyanagaster necrorhizus MCA 3950]KAG7440679.1 hypothetical protein BT62DRAFT_575574 [Guyanagaster necrorhizus MCA 3950]KAG7440692.1 hypothetical protein BT62DRAFT_575669 [Guyanagaster necrorhizus MCA 3950]